MFRSPKPFLIAPLVLFLGGMGTFSRFFAPEPLELDQFNALYDTPAPAPKGALNIFHIGHSLVGQDMPAMLMQMADASIGPGHDYRTQAGWGTFMKAHWDPDVPINGFEEGNSHAFYRDAREAVHSGTLDALVITEAVEIRDSIKYMESPHMLHNWADAAWSAKTDTKVYFYETWHHLTDPEGWLERLDRDLGLYWEGQILRPALNMQEEQQTGLRPIYVIPGGQVMAKVTRAIEGSDGVGSLKTRQDLFKDAIHFNDYGAYLMALTHYAVLYQRSPIGLPHQLNKADGTPAQSPGPEAAALMQELVWEVVTSYAPTGVKG